MPKFGTYADGGDPRPTDVAVVKRGTDTVKVKGVGGMAGKGIATARFDLPTNAARVQFLSASGWHSAAATAAMTKGKYLMALSEVKSCTPENLTINVGGSPGASDTCYYVLYNVDANGFPTTLAYSWGPFATSAAGSFNVTGQSTAVAGGLYYEGVFTPTGNSGSMTITQGAKSTLLHPMANAALITRGFGIETGDTTHSTPQNLSSFTFAATGAATAFGYVNGTTPLIMTYNKAA